MTPPDLFARLFDDAATFPPGNMPLGQAVTAHLAHEQAPYAGLVGPFVVAAKDLEALAGEVGTEVLRVSVTAPLAGLRAAVATAGQVPGLALQAVEVVLPAGYAARAAIAALDDVLAGHPTVGYVEIPRDERRGEVIAALAGSPYRAKIRTGGVTADLYPSTEELAGTVCALVAAGLPFKATAGLHHAIRNTDPATGFDQHGFLNLLVAAARARDGGSVRDVGAALDERDEWRVAGHVERLAPSVREDFVSFGTCSIAEPIGELADCGLLPDGYEVAVGREGVR